MTPSKHIPSLSAAGAALLRRDVMTRRVVWAHAPEAAPPPGTLGWPPSSIADLAVLGLVPCVVLPGAEGPAPDHAVVLDATPDAEAVAPMEARARELLLDSLLRAAGTSEAASPLRFSVIIATYRRVARAIQAVQACYDLAYPHEAYELIVVDNDQDHEPLQAALRACQQERDGSGPALRLCHMPITGVSVARNAGISLTRGEIIASLDDDCLPETAWLAKLDEAWQALPDAGVIGGKLLLQLPDPAPEVFQSGWEALWSHLPLSGDQLIRCEGWRSYPWGGNWSARRDTLLRLGGFPWRYGSRGCPYAGGEEIALGAAIALEGLPLYLSPAATVVHSPSTDRYTMEHVRQTMAAGALLEHRLYQDGLIPTAASRWGTLGQMLRAAGTMVAAGMLGQRAMARDRRLRLGALANKLLVQWGLRHVYPQDTQNP